MRKDNFSCFYKNAIFNNVQAIEIAKLTRNSTGRIAKVAYWPF